VARTAGAAVFCHAPLLASHAGPVPALVSQLNVERFDSDLGFERWLVRNRVRCGVLFHNAIAVIRLLQATRAPLTWFAGHVHRRGGFRMDKTSGALRDLSQAPVEHDGSIDFVQAPSLGLHGARAHDHPGYLLAAVRGGRLTAHRYCSLGQEDEFE